MTPDFLIRANGEDLTAKVKDRLLSLVITDGEGMEADTLEITIDNRERAVAEPPTGALLSVALGYAGEALFEMGSWTVNATGGSGPVETLVIRAEPADLAGPIRSPRTQSWEDTTIGGIVRSIAARAGLRDFVSPSLAPVPIAYEAQTAESDLHFVTRLAARFDAIAKPADGRLVVTKRGEGLGDPIPVRRDDGSTTWNWERGERDKYASVTARFDDPDAGREGTVQVGAGEPVRELRRVHASAAEARAAANAALGKAGRGEVTYHVDLSRFRGDLFGGGRVALSGYADAMDGLGELRTVTHTLDGAGLITAFDGARTT